MTSGYPDSFRGVSPKWLFFLGLSPARDRSLFERIFESTVVGLLRLYRTPSTGSIIQMLPVSSAMPKTILSRATPSSSDGMPTLPIESRAW